MSIIIIPPVNKGLINAVLINGMNDAMKSNKILFFPGISILIYLLHIDDIILYIYIYM